MHKARILHLLRRLGHLQKGTVAEKLAALREMPFEELAVTTANAKRLFRIG